MPGIFGGSGCSPKTLESLHEQYRGLWGQECDFHRTWSGGVGGHVSGGGSALSSMDRPSYIIGIDADRAGYRALRRESRGPGASIFRVRSGLVDIHPEFTGNVVALERSSGVLHLGVEWSGAFSMFYTQEGTGGVLFSSLLRPLARAIEAEIDPLGILQFLQNGYNLNNRTAFQGVYRMRPGEVLRYDPSDDALSVADRSKLWTGAPLTDSKELVETALELLMRSVDRAVEDDDSTALMMSGGWDSRTLLAVNVSLVRNELGAPVTAYSHGDVQSRELDIVSRICERVDIDCHLQSIGKDILRPEFIRDSFQSCGLAIFPHWANAGSKLASSGFKSAMAGVFGEVLGGHYGYGMTESGLGKITALAKDWLNLGPYSGADGIESVLPLFEIDSSTQGEHWYLKREFETSISDSDSRTKEDIERALRRFSDRGIHQANRLIEAMITEHRGSQYIAGQTASVRAEGVDVSLPFADRRLLWFASRIHPRVKLHNSLSRRIIAEASQSLLDYPMAATLVPASSPLLLQESSRALRKVWEAVRWELYSTSNGKIPRPHFSWVNFEFMREGGVLNQVVDDLRADLWDITAIRQKIQQITNPRSVERLHPYFDQFGKIMTIDHMLR